MSIQLRTLLAAVLMLTLMAPAANAQILVNGVPVPAPYETDFEYVVDNAVAGDSIYVPDGVYQITGTAQVSAPNVTIQGQSEAGTIIEVNLASNGWGLATNRDNTTIRDLTFESISTGAEVGFIIKGNPAPGPTVVNGVTIERVTVFGDATSTPKRRAGIDLNGFDNVVIDDVDSRDASWGNGIQLSGCHNVQITNAETSNNVWGSIAIYCTNDLGPGNNRGSDNVTITGGSYSDTPLARPQIYIEDEFGVFNTNISVTGWDYYVRNTQFRNALGLADSEEFTYVVDTEANAVAFALDFVGYEEFSSIERISDGNFVVAAGMSIQAAIDAAPANGTVEVATGSYNEQIVIGKDMSVIGAGIGNSIITSPATLTSTFSTSYPYHPIVTMTGGSNVLFQGFTVDGLGNGNANNRFVGIGLHNADATIDACRVTGIRETPFSGNQHGIGIYAYHNDGTSYSNVVTNCVVDDFQKNGITLNSDGTVQTAIAVDVSGNTVNGVGATPVTAQNGIQVWGDLITGTIDGNDISGIGYTGSGWAASGILDYASGDVDITNNVISGSQYSIYKYSGNGEIVGNQVTVPEQIGGASIGIIASDPPERVPSPFSSDDQSQASGATKLEQPKSGVLNVLVADNTVVFSGVDNTGTWGIESYAGWTTEDIAIVVTNNTVNGFPVGMGVYQSTSSTGVFTSVAVNQNDFSGNDIGFQTNVDYLTIDGSCNWWGDLSGPFESTLNPAGTGSDVIGDISFAPWLDAAGGNCDQYGPNFASAGPAPSELNACSDCISVPVDLTRGDTSAARGVSVTFALSANLELCGSTPWISSGPGSFYDGFVNDVQEFLLDNGDGTYTYDTAILGTNCGPTTGGELFTIPVSFVAGLTGDQTGTIDIVGVTFRDCANAPLPLLPGPGTTVEIDLTAPGVVTDLAATQVKSGNDSNGTTKIDLTWTLPADTDLTGVRLFRKGFGNYPEYDDLGGAVPTTPADPTAALGDGWTELTVTPLAPTATSYTDEPAMRDFWYYVAFVEDECYVSAVSGQTGGTLNYHLGDVVPGAGNNLVFTGDISALGGAYGTFDGDVDYLAKVDVGPTTDFSVDARPTTDNQIQFEDLIVFAINYNSVGRLAPVQPAIANALSLVEPTELTVGQEIRVPVEFASDGTIQGLSVALDWNDAVLEYVGWTAGDLASGQNRTMPVFSPKTGVIDAAVMGVSDLGIAGEGTLAHLRFRVKAEGAADLRFESVDARSTTNEKITLDGTLVQEAPNTPALVSRSTLRSNVPNPFNPSTKVRFALAEQGHVSVRIFDVKGRLVRTLVDAPMTAGEHEIQWNGTDDSGRTVGSGTYLMRMDAPDATASRRLMLVK